MKSKEYISIEDILLVEEELEKLIVFENEFMIVFKVFEEIATPNKNWIKRIQLVKWKKQKQDKYVIDFRSYSKKKNVYGKGISFSIDEFNKLVNGITGFNISEEI